MRVSSFFRFIFVLAHAFFWPDYSNLWGFECDHGPIESTQRQETLLIELQFVSPLLMPLAQMALVSLFLGLRLAWRRLPCAKRGSRAGYAALGLGAPAAGGARGSAAAAEAAAVAAAAADEDASGRGVMIRPFGHFDRWFSTIVLVLQLEAAFILRAVFTRFAKLTYANGQQW